MSARLPDELRAHLLEPVNPREPARVDRRGEAHNPICRDHVVLYLQLDGLRIEDAGHRATGCPVAMAYASAATELLLGRELSADLPATILVELEERFGEPNAAKRHAPALVGEALGACVWCGGSA